MGFEGRQRAELEAEARARQARPTHSDQRLAGPIAGPLVCMAYVFLLLFLPIFEVECPGMTVSWSGLELARGSQGDVSGELADMTTGNSFELQSGSQNDIPKDPLVLALPALAVLVALALLAGSRTGANVLLVLLVGALLYFSTIGFKIEHELESGLAQAVTQMPDDPTTTMMGPSIQLAKQALRDSASRTTWFWLGWVATLLALALVNLTWLKRALGRSPP